MNVGTITLDNNHQSIYAICVNDKVISLWTDYNKAWDKITQLRQEHSIFHNSFYIHTYNLNKDPDDTWLYYILRSVVRGTTIQEAQNIPQDIPQDISQDIPQDHNDD
jgi:hypothetical protein